MVKNKEVLLSLPIRVLSNRLVDHLGRKTPLRKSVYAPSTFSFAFD